MAIISDGNLALEIRFRELDDQNWIQYDVLFLYKGETIIREEQLKRVNDFWAKGPPGAFRANELGHDEIIETLETALETDEPQFYEPTDPDFILAVYPKMHFPFIPRNWILLRASEEAIQQQEDRELVREVAGGRLPDDIFTLIMMVDIYNFGDEYVYHGSGPALIMLVERYALRVFVDQLHAEYDAFCQAFHIAPKPPRNEDDNFEINSLDDQKRFMGLDPDDQDKDEEDKENNE